MHDVLKGHLEVVEEVPDGLALSPDVEVVHPQLTLLLPALHYISVRTSTPSELGLTPLLPIRLAPTNPTFGLQQEGGCKNHCPVVIIDLPHYVPESTIFPEKIGLSCLLKIGATTASICKLARGGFGGGGERQGGTGWVLKLGCINSALIISSNDKIDHPGGRHRLLHVRDAEPDRRHPYPLP